MKDLRYDILLLAPVGFTARISCLKLHANAK
jgi:hypothetical protein